MYEGESTNTMRITRTINNVNISNNNSNSNSNNDNSNNNSNNNSNYIKGTSNMYSTFGSSSFPVLMPRKAVE